MGRLIDRPVKKLFPLQFNSKYTSADGSGDKK